MPTSTRAEVGHSGSGGKVRAGHTAVQGQACVAIHFRVPFARRIMNSDDSRMARLRLFMLCFSFLRGKDSARRAKCKRKAERFSFCISEPPPILWKDSARRAKCKRKAESFSFCISEPPPILSKVMDYGIRRSPQMTEAGIGSDGALGARASSPLQFKQAGCLLFQWLTQRFALNHGVKMCGPPCLSEKPGQPHHSGPSG